MLVLGARRRLQSKTPFLDDSGGNWDELIFFRLKATFSGLGVQSVKLILGSFSGLILAYCGFI